MDKCYVWGVTMFGAVTWNFMKEDLKLVKFGFREIWLKRTSLKHKCNVMRNEEILKGIGEEMTTLGRSKERR